MFGIMLQKMWHKKWMNLSLLVGCVLLVATVVSFPLYEKAAYDRMLQDEFDKVISQDGRWPISLNLATLSKKDKSGLVEKIEKVVNSIYDDIGVKEGQTISFYSLQRVPVTSSFNRDDASNIYVCLGAMTDFEPHIEIINGEGISETGLSENGAIEVVVSEECLVSQGLLVGEELTFEGANIEGEPIRILIKGVFKKENSSDFYWQLTDAALLSTVFMDADLFRDYFTGDKISKYTVNCKYYALADYKSIKYEDVAHIAERTEYYTKKSKYRSVIEKPLYTDTLDEYSKKINRISATLMILQIPVLIMLCAFLLMISGQMYEMEKNEISVIKSRGSSRGQIFTLYFYQSLLLTLTGGALGVPLGMTFSRILGATRNFLEFDSSQTLSIIFTDKALFYALGAMLLTMLSLTLPAIKHSKVSIVNLKQQKAVKKKNLWEKLYLDIVLIGVSVYGYYSFNKNMTDLSESVLEGKSLDPLLYISSSLFILGLGLLFLRLQPYIVLLIYNIGKRFWKSASYVSFLENIKNGRKQQLIMLFLIMTISLGIYHATVARTILDNAIENTNYLDGAEVVIKENWPLSNDPNNQGEAKYIEPSYTRFMTMDCADATTKVFFDKEGYITNKKNEKQIITIMGIHTKEFGSMTSVSAELLEKPYREYLNELAAVSDGVILSSNFKSMLGYDVGEAINFKNSKGEDINAKIVDFVDYWPGYSPRVKEMNSDQTVANKDCFLLITHYDILKQKFALSPYEVWIDTKDGTTTADIYNWIEKQNLSVNKYINKDSDIKNTMEDPLLQGTNGVLTMGFAVTILLCAIGYLIYWIMAIRERELMFGVLRACGFHKGELVHMLINEQIFCGVFSVFAGIGIGKLSSKMFVPILQQAYASENQVLPMKLITDTQDMVRLYGVVAAAMLVALMVLVVILFKMNVAKALKLGEE